MIAPCTDTEPEPVRESVRAPKSLLTLFAVFNFEEFGDNLRALATDGVGSKLQIASMMGHWSGVGIDCMAMNVNDLLCVGAEPIAFVDYIAVPKKVMLHQISNYVY